MRTINMPPQIHIPQNCDPVCVVLLCVVCAMQGYRVSGLMAQTQVKLSVYCLYPRLQAGHDRVSYNTSPLIILMIHITPGT